MLSSKGSFSVTRWLFVWPLLLALVVVAGCQQQTATTVEQSPSENGATPAGDVGDEAITELPHEEFNKFAGDAADDTQPNAIPVPDGSPEELLEFMNKISARELDGGDENVFDEMRQIVSARLRAAEKILDQKDVGLHVIAIETKLESLRNLSALGEEDAFETFQEYARKLAKHPDDEKAILGRIGLFRALVDELVTAGQGDQDQIAHQLDEVLSGEGVTPPNLQLLSEATDSLRQAGFTDLAAKLMRRIGDGLEKNSDPDVAADASSIRAGADVVRIGELVNNVILKKEDAVNSLNTEVRRILDNGPSEKVLQLLLDFAERLETTAQPQVAERLYKQIDEAAEKNPDPEQVAGIRHSIESATRRISLLGKPLRIEGKHFNGRPFDWDRYSNKVVLVEFWATWCVPCIEELPRIKAIYQEFHERGFDVVGINLDADRDKVAEFLQGQDIPWATVVSDDPSQPNRNAQHCGVDMIPFLAIVGRDGKVVDIHVRGDELRARLEDLLSPETAPNESTAATLPHNPIQLVSAEEDVAAESDEPLARERFELDTESNPYLAPLGLNSIELFNFILDMQDKPKVIQRRDGFTESIVDAANRILEDNESSERIRTQAILAKFEYLHRDACLGDQQADQALLALAGEHQDHANQAVQTEVVLARNEEKARQLVEGDPQELGNGLDELLSYVEQTECTSRHLRLASNVVEAMNQIEDTDAREVYFVKLGKLLATSKSKDVARYGRRLAGTSAQPSQSSLVGQAMELRGVTSDGLPFNWDEYRGQIVIVDFWATWCGPCRAAMPELKDLLEKKADQGLQIVGVSLDEDADVLAAYLQENDLPWTHLAGQECRDLADKYSVRAIPALFLVDRDGKIVATDNRLAQLLPKIESLLESK